jgi:Kef-type K+ transport system membrane component KefB
MTAFHAQTEHVLVGLLLQFVVILIAARVGGRLGARIGQSQSVSEILAGLMLGPSCLGWFAPGAFAALFPSDGPSILPYFSHIGLVLALFLIGASFDFAHLRGQSGRSAALAAGTLVAPLALGFVLGPPLRAAMPGESSELAWALFLGLVLGITAIPILGRILVEVGLHQHPVGVLAIATGAGKDVFTWLTLIIALGVARPPLDVGAFFGTVGGAIALVAVVLGVGRRAIAWSVRGWDGDPATLSPNVIVALLAATFLAAAASASLHLFAIFGAFLSGVAVASHRPLAAAVTTRLSDLVMLFLLPVFFASTGLRTDLTLLTGGLWVWVPVVTLLGTVATGGVAVAIARASGLPWASSLAVGVSLNTPGLMALILLNAGRDAGVVPPDAFAVLMAAAMLRNLLTVPTLRALAPAVMQQNFVSGRA